jgi:hypothetical protein
VQYWLEQNGHALKATIRLEVQRCALSTLRPANVRMEDLASASRDRQRPGAFVQPPSRRPRAGTERRRRKKNKWTNVEAAGRHRSRRKRPPTDLRMPAGVSTRCNGGALTQQFQQIASSAIGTPPT